MKKTLWEEIQDKASGYLSEMDERDLMAEGKYIKEAEDDDEPVSDEEDDTAGDESMSDEGNVDDEPVSDEEDDTDGDESMSDEPMSDEPVSDGGEGGAGEELGEVNFNDITIKDVADAVKVLSKHLDKTHKKVSGINFNKLPFAKQQEVLSSLEAMYSKVKELVEEMDAFNDLNWHE